MSIQKITITYYRLFLVTFSYGNEGERTKKAGYFSDKKEAEKVAALKKGAYGTTGKVVVKDFKALSDVPEYFEKADEWARENLTVNEYDKFCKNQ